MAQFIEATEWFFLVFFSALHAAYLGLYFLSLFSISGYIRDSRAERLPTVFAGLEPPLSIVVAAYNEQDEAVQAVLSMLDQRYPTLEVIVVNDGSSDETLQRLLQAFACEPEEQAPRAALPCRPVRGLYRSTLRPNLLLIDKERGGKADAVNAGLNFARYPLACVLDADSVLGPRSLLHGVQPFLSDPRTIATGGTILVNNGCTIGENGFITRVGLAPNYWVLVQSIEYIRTFMFGRFGWAPLNGVPIVSGAFGIFDLRVLIAAGGYRTDTIGEDMELTLRLHRYALESGRRYRISFVPDPVCWTRVPDTLKVLRRQRARWHRGLAESLSMNRGLLLKPSVAGWLTFPFFILFEWLGPVVELAGYLLAVAAYVLGILSFEALGAFLFLALATGMLLSVNALVLEQMAFGILPRLRQFLLLCLFSVLENVGFRQLYTVWRLTGLVQWLRQRGTSSGGTW